MTIYGERFLKAQQSCIAILGVNGFIGSHLLEHLLAQTDYHVIGFDCHADVVGAIHHPNFEFHQGDLLHDIARVDAIIERADIVLPLVAIATPAVYVREPLRVFELDFEANLRVLRSCVRLKKRVVFPSSSEVYGMCSDAVFHEESSHLVYGPTQKHRWIYASSKQLLDRIICAYGERDGLSYSIFRPFNWLGPRLDRASSVKAGEARALTQFIGNALSGKPLAVVDGGAQQRSFIDMQDAICALHRIIDNEAGCAEQRVFNIGFPENVYSIQALAEFVQSYAADKGIEVHIQTTTGDRHYGKAYQDIQQRVPDIGLAKTHLHWRPHIGLAQTVARTFDYYLTHGF